MRDVALLIPCRNEATHLDRALSELRVALERCPHVASVVLVLDSCTDKSETIARAHQNLFPAESPLLCLTVEAGGKAEAVRAGLALVTAPFTCLWDADREYGWASLPLVLAACAPGTMVTGARCGGLSTSSTLANAAARLALSGADQPAPTDILTAVHAAETDFIRTAVSAANGFSLEACLIRYALDANLYLLSIPVAYRRRDRRAGKKITMFDLAPILAACLTRTLPRQRPPVIARLARFLVVGFAAYLLNVALVETLIGIGEPVTTSQLAGWVAACTFTWLGNRRIAHTPPLTATSEWAYWLLSQSPGGLVYATVFAAIYAFNPQASIAVAAGTLVSLTFNFVLGDAIASASAKKATKPKASAARADPLPHGLPQRLPTKMQS